MKRIPLVNGGETLVDDRDYFTLSRYDWYLSKKGYAFRTDYLKGGRKRAVVMHQVILGAQKGMDTDHIDMNKLNNQRSNLRRVTRAQNMQNKPKKTGTTSKYLGVHLSNGKWVAAITVNKKLVYLGTYRHELVAAVAYNKAAKEHYGEFARINTW